MKTVTSFNPKSTTTTYLPEIDVKLDSLPSKGITYPANSQIKYKPYTFGEVKKISQSKLSTKDIFNFILEGIQCSFDKLDLTVGDFLYLGLLRKISSFGDAKFQITSPCICGNKNFIIVDISKLEFEDLNVPSLPVYVTFNDKEYAFTPLTLKDYYKAIDNGYETDSVALLSYSARNIEFNEMYNVFMNLTAKDFQLVSHLDKLLYHGVKPIVSHCSCGRDNEVELDGGQALLLPFRTDTESFAGRIRFGSKTAH